MTRYAEVSHTEWIAAGVETVRQQFADLRHHIEHNVHPKLTFKILEESAGHARFEQSVKLLGIRQRDVFERVVSADGTIVDTSVEGFNKGGSLRFCFEPALRMGRRGSLVTTMIRLPLPPVIGGLVKPLLERQIRLELHAAVQEDKVDIEQRGYVPRAAAASA